MLRKRNRDGKKEVKVYSLYITKSGNVKERVDHVRREFGN